MLAICKIKNPTGPYIYIYFMCCWNGAAPLQSMVSLLNWFGKRTQRRTNWRPHFLHKHFPNSNVTYIQETHLTVYFSLLHKLNKTITSYHIYHSFSDITRNENQKTYHYTHTKSTLKYLIFHFLILRKIQIILHCLHNNKLHHPKHLQATTSS